MKTSLKLSIATAVIASVVMGSAFAATKPPTLRADSMTVTIGSSETVNVLANDITTASTITKVEAGRTKYGTADCTTVGSCTYTPDPARAARFKSDSFTYTVTYKDAKGKERKRSSRVTVKLKPAPVSPA